MCVYIFRKKKRINIIKRPKASSLKEKKNKEEKTMLSKN